MVLCDYVQNSPSQRKDCDPRQCGNGFQVRGSQGCRFFALDRVRKLPGFKGEGQVMKTFRGHGTYMFMNARSEYAKVEAAKIAMTA